MEDSTCYTRTLNSTLAGKDPYEVRVVRHSLLYPPTALLVIEPLRLVSDPLRLAAARDGSEHRLGGRHGLWRRPGTTATAWSGAGSSFRWPWGSFRS